jgi:hypothetical protein
VFILAREVPGTPHEDGLARAAGLTGRSGQDLIEAIDALGARLGRRVPLVVDGLNEADEPRAWRDVIARLRGLLPAYPNVLGLVTCRPSYADAILPEAVERLVLPGFQGVEEDAVNRYFTAYRIHARPNDLPWWPLNDPLLLSIFCRTVNPQRDRDVHVTELPTSLTEVLENYIDDVIARICDRMNIAYTADVRDPLLHLASAFFDRGVRELPRSEVRTLLGDQQRANFQASLQHQLESEEILGRDLLADTEQVLWNYDLVGGHLIAKAVLSRWTDPETELAQPEFLSGLDGHPLREDIVSALAGLLMPDGIELWRIVSGQPNVALIARVALPGLPSEMVSGRAVEAVVATFETDPDATLDSLESSTLVPGHPLNAQILDRLLTPLEVADRDLRWTEWVRRRADSLIPQLEQISRRLTTVPVDEELSDALVTWLSWLLTTTNRPLRDQAVHALYSFGLRHPESLFRRTEAMLDINDRSIAEGLMAAAYGVAMAAQEPGSDLIENVLAFADRVSESLLTDGATRPTTHWLIREYAFRLRQLAGWLRSGQLPDQATQPPLPAPAGEVSGFARDDPGWTAVDEAFMLDFSNYTIGRLVEDRGNYDNDHPEFIRITGEIRKRVADLGWTPERFGDLDGSIARLQETRGELDPAKTERYGKKYAWIGLYEAAGRLSDQSALPTDAGSSWRMADIVIDPSFPAPPPRIDHALPRWGDDYPADDAAWLASGVVDVPDQLLRPDVLNGVAGPWIALEGFFRPERDSIHRSIFCFVRGTLALGGWATVQNWIADHGVTNDTVPRVSGDYYTFGGEAPWSPTFDALATARDGTVKPHVEVLGGRSGGSEVELLSVDFSWESHHSVLNQSESLVLPSKAFALAAGLRGMRGTTSFSTANGEVGAQVVDTPDDWRGCVLYVREDLLRSYCRCRHGEYGWIAWGERQIQWDHAQPAPEWLRQLRATGADRFSRVTSLDELAS